MTAAMNSQPVKRKELEVVPFTRVCFAKSPNTPSTKHLSRSNCAHPIQAQYLSNATFADITANDPTKTEFIR